MSSSGPGTPAACSRAITITSTGGNCWRTRRKDSMAFLILIGAAVAFHGALGNALGNGQAQSRVTEFVEPIAQMKTAAAKATADMAQRGEVTSAAKPRFARQAGGAVIVINLNESGG